jgi:ssDNA-binding Zn-finger/Zn-ribbon topoisomerase 1
VAGGTHLVRSHLRRLELISAVELQGIVKTYGMCCPKCSSERISITLRTDKNRFVIECSGCGATTEGAQLIAEETGPMLAETILVTRSRGRWTARWDVLSRRADERWSDWSATDAARVKRKRKEYRKRVEEEGGRPICPLCGARMRRVKPRPNDRWKAFWGCSQYSITGCKGAVRDRT